jgi:hypothetical protein
VPVAFSDSTGRAGDGSYPEVVADYPYEAKRKVEALIATLQELIKRDPDQEVQGIAVPVLDATLGEIKAAKPDDAVVKSIVDVVSADTIGAGEPIRAADMLVVAKQLDAAIGPRPPLIV